MKTSTERILTTHTGSLPRPDYLATMLFAKERGELRDEELLRRAVQPAIAEVVRKQVDNGVDIINDGETGKSGYASYVKERMTGFEGRGVPPQMTDMRDFPEFMRRFLPTGPMAGIRTPACNGAVVSKNRQALQQELDDFKAALIGVHPEETFLTAASPGIISLFFVNQHYPSHEAYLSALADAMKEEYQAIYEAGFVLQVDCPDLAMGRHLQFGDATLEEFRRNAELHIEALNHALAGIPPDRMRMHLCWGNYEGPHHRDVPLKDIIDIVLKARPLGLVLEAANPRHEHEWKVFQDVKLPDGKVLVPGVIDSTSNYIEHPELVAERLLRYARIVGRENVIAGTDCGFATFVGSVLVDPKIMWAKFQTMAEGARLASQELWRR